MKHHTPGPLTARKSSNNARWVVETSKGALIADFFNVHSEGNAMLFAAAPDMAVALQEIANSVALVLPSMPKKLQPGFAEIARVARAALVRAGVQ